MATITDQFARLLRSRQVRRLSDRAQDLARDPRTRRKLEDLRGRLARKR